MNVWLIILIVFGTIGISMSIFAVVFKPLSMYMNKPDEKNPMEGKLVKFVSNEAEAKNADGVRGHLEPVGQSEHRGGIYESFFKRLLDIIISFFALILLSPVFLVLCVWILIDDPGPVIFTQKRIGKDKRYFMLHKFRTMKMSAPHDIPTHMLNTPMDHITRSGKFLRKHSLDELPQVWDIFIGNMSFVGPRPGLWNQDLLTAERDKYGANNVKPGLTGLAQINGRDELEIPEKARLDGEYCKNLGISMDLKCFFGSLGVFKGDKNIKEGSHD